MIESLLLAITRVGTWREGNSLTHATGFFFQRNQQLFLVSNRHVFINEPTNHYPDGIEIELHTDPENVSKITQFSIPLYAGEKPLWRQGSDSVGNVDVAVIQIDRSAMPETLLMQAFKPEHLVKDLDRIEVGTSVLTVGFPLGFHDDLHHLPVARQAIIASAFGIRFDGNGYFLTDARMHRGASGSPVVARSKGNISGRSHLPWMLLGIHSTRIDVDRDISQDDRLNLNCAWYADILLTLTENTINLLRFDYINWQVFVRK